MRKLLASIRVRLARLGKPAPKPELGRYGVSEHAYWRPPAEPAEPGWLDRRALDRPFGPPAQRF